MHDSSVWSSSESSSNLWDLFVPTHKIKTEELFVCHCKGLWLWEAHNHRKEPWRKTGASKSTARSLTGKGMFDAWSFWGPYSTGSKTPLPSWHEIERVPSKLQRSLWFFGRTQKVANPVFGFHWHSSQNILFDDTICKVSREMPQIPQDNILLLERKTLASKKILQQFRGTQRISESYSIIFFLIWSLNGESQLMKILPSTSSTILLIEEILHHLKCINPCK